jgi:sugar phosphate isomerase/epimerase
MTRVSIGTWAFGIFTGRPLPFDEMLDRVAALEFEGAELGAFAPHPDPGTCATKADRARLAESFASRGLELSAVATDFGSSSILGDPATYLAALDRNLAFCQDVGSLRLIVNTLDPPEAVTEIGEAAAMGRLLGTWREAAARAEAAGVTLVFEFEPCWALNEPEQVITIAHELAGPGFGVLYDTAHAHIVSTVGVAGRPNKTLPGGQVELLRRLAGTIAHVHLLDSDGSIHEGESSTERTTVHTPFGRGNVDFDQVIPALVRARGNVDWWTVDLCFWPDPWAEAEASKRFVDELVRTHLGTAQATSPRP